MGRRVLLLLAGLLGAVLLAGGVIQISAGQAPSPSPQHVAANPGTGFTYQGVLRDGGQPANGTYEFSFALWDAEAGGNQLGNTLQQQLPVADGLFTAGLDFGEVVKGQALWLEIAVRPLGTVSWQTLTPRQQLSAAPLALALPGLRTQQRITSPNIIGGYALNKVAPGVYGAVIAGGGMAEIYNYDNEVTGNFGAIGGGAANLAGSASTIGGGFGNYAPYTYTVIGGGVGNRVDAVAGTVVGGQQNWANGWASFAGGGESNSSWYTMSTVVGGGLNQVLAGYGTIGGGYGNTIWAERGTIGGGWTNVVSATGGTIGGGGRYEDAEAGVDYEGNAVSGEYGTVGGGSGNEATWGATAGGGLGNQATGSGSTVAGGLDNQAGGPGSAVGGGRGNSATGQEAAIPGGLDNVANAAYTFAAGCGAQAIHDGSFVWADSRTCAPFASQRDYQFRARAWGGAMFDDDVGNSVEMLYGSGIINVSNGAYLSWGGTWTNASDVALKDGFAPVAGAEVLERVASLPLQTWHYKEEGSDVRHLGPTAQDFHAAFGLGDSARTISTVDADGVALAAIQALNERAEAQAAEIRSLRRELERLQLPEEGRTLWRGARWQDLLLLLLFAAVAGPRLRRPWRRAKRLMLPPDA